MTVYFHLISLSLYIIKKEAPLNRSDFGIQKREKRQSIVIRPPRFKISMGALLWQYWLWSF